MIRPPLWPWETTAESLGSQTDPVLNHPHHPVPDPVTGNLVIDPEIVLPAQGFGLEISLFYNSASSTNTAWGKLRSASVSAQLQISGSTVYLLRGDGKAYAFSGSWSPATPSSMTPNAAMYSGTQLDWDGAQFIETFADGKTITYGKELVADVCYAVSEIADPSGNVHTYTYDGNNLESIEVPGGNRVTFLYDSGHVETIQDWGGRRWTMTYDGDGQLTHLTTPTGCQTEYHQAGTDGLIEAITDPRGYATSYTYESSNRVETVSRGSAVWTYTYSGSIGDFGGSEVMSPTGAITTFLLDAQVRLGAKVMPEGYRVTTSYDANNNIVQEEMPYGLVRNVTLNSFNQPLTSADALGNVTSFVYDVSNNLVSLMNALGEVTTMTYDGQRRMTSQMDALGRVTTHVWNGNGTLQATVDGRGLRTTYAYDTVGNMVSTLYSDGSVAT
ncbi:MAG: RHS repeat protein, partial [Fimbriimonadaceae bacterium]|nr:RHS repeat protein [Fimbriimonadaceae bacterium]